MELQGRRILLGITGGIAAYKSAVLCRLLKRAGAEVRVVMTEHAKQFIAPLTMATLSGHPVLTEFFDPGNGAWNSHVSLGEWAECLVVAPATANTLAKMAAGIADNLLLTTCLSARCPVVVAPAMDLDMYAHAATRHNLATLAARGAGIVEAGEGELASGLCGKGRMAEPEAIAAFVGRTLAEAGAGSETRPKENAAASGGAPGGPAEGRTAAQPAPEPQPSDHIPAEGAGPEPHRISAGNPCRQALAGKRFVVTAGPTIEAIDPVRFLSNHSSGRMGYAIAGQLARRGAAVTLVSGRTALDAPAGVERIDVLSAEEMYEATAAAFADADGAVMCAAVADYTPCEVADRKLQKGEGDLTIRLRRTRDIAAELGARKGDRLLVGFALETHDEREHARAKLERKHFDFIVLNSLRDAGAGFRGETNKATLIDRTSSEELPLLTKHELACRIADRIAALAAGRTR